METHNEAGCGFQTSIQDKSQTGQRKKNKVSKLQARLCPDFDIRDTLKPENDNSYLKTYLQSLYQQELDPKSMDFETLITFLNPTFIIDYLRQILHFFKSNLSDISFPNVISYMEEFLIRIAQNNACLTCPMFSADSQRIGKQIFIIVHQNRHHYKWKYFYGTGKFVDK